MRTVVFSCRGSYGVGKGAMESVVLRARCVGVLLVNTDESETDLQKHMVKSTF